MRIVGTKNNAIDADLLERLAKSRMSGGVVSKTELNTALGSVRTGLKDEFSGASSVRGLAKAQTAIANTLKLAVDSGWVGKGATKAAVTEFLTGRGKTSLATTIATVKEDIKSSGGGSVGYRPAGGARSGGGESSGRVRSGGGESSGSWTARTGT